MARIVNLNKESEIEPSISGEIKSRLGDIYGGQDSVVNILSEAVAKEIIALRRENEFVFSQNQLSNAGGENLDRLAFEHYKLNRRAPSKGRVFAGEKNLHFYVETGDFGDINSGQDIQLPAGTIVSVDGNSFADSSVSYKLLYDYTLSATDSFAYCSAEALNPGTYSNTASETLVYHNFTNYSDALNDSLKVTNKYPIVNGDEAETDESLRFRAVNYMQSYANMNSEMIRLQALTVPGVEEINIIPSYYGIGTTGVVVFGSGRENNINMIDLVRDRLREVNMLGRNIVVSQGIKVYLDMTIRVNIREGLSNLEKSDLKADIKNIVFSEFKLAEISKKIDLLKISRSIQRSRGNKVILGFGTGNSNNIFESVFLRKTDIDSIFPEEKTEVKENIITVGLDERIGFGEVTVILEEEIL
jgi:uncharacterized phage protein gp47/JayE